MCSNSIQTYQHPHSPYIINVDTTESVRHEQFSFQMFFQGDSSNVIFKSAFRTVDNGKQTQNTHNDEMV